MLFDSTVRRETARSFGATLVVILTIVITMMLVSTISKAAGGVVAPEDVVLVLGYSALQHVPTMLTLSLFIAVVVSLGRMYRDSEMVIWFASGIGLARVVRPVLRMAWPVLLVVGVLLLFVWPWANRSGTEIRQRYEQRSDLSRVAPGVFQTSRDGSRVFFVDRASHEPAQAGAAGRPPRGTEPGGEATLAHEGTESHNVFILQRKADVESVTSARSGRLEVLGDDRMLVLEHGQRNEANTASGTRTLASFESYRVLADDKAVRRATEAPARSLPTIELLRNPTPRNQGELAWRFGLLLAAGNLLLLGVGLAATNPRRASNWNLLFALLAFIVYFNLINLSQAWINAGRMGMGPMLLLLHGGAFVLALGLLWWRDNGQAMFSGHRSAAAAAAATPASPASPAKGAA